MQTALNIILKIPQQGGHYLKKPGETLKNLEFQIGTLKTLKKDKILEKP